MNNAKKSANNIATSMLSQLVTIALGIVIPRLVLVNLGSETNGLLNSINQILAYVALVEAGVGGASLQALYKPCAEQNRTRISQVLAATSRFYQKTGVLYSVIVLFLTFAFPFTLNMDIPRKTVMIVMFLSGMPGVVNYYFQGKYKILLQAEGKSYITTNLTTIIYILTSVSKIILLCAGFNIIALQTMYLAFSIAQMLYIVSYIRKHYSWLDVKVKPDYDAISQSKNVLIHQVAALVFNNTDIIVLTYFCGLKAVSVYSMYAMLFGMVQTLVYNFSGMNFALGQYFNTDREKYLKMHDAYEVFNMGLTFCLFCMAGIFILPFLTLYTAGVNDISYIDRYLPYLFIATYLMSNGRNSSNQAINFAQHFKKTQWRAVLEAVINLSVSLLAVWKFGIYGVLVGTIAALLYRTNDVIIYANRKILDRNPWITYRRWVMNFVLFVFITVAAKFALQNALLDNYFKLIFVAIISSLIVIAAFVGVTFIFEKKTCLYIKSILAPFWNKIKSYLPKKHSSS